MTTTITQASTYEHGILRVNFICPCGHWVTLREGDFSDNEYVICNDCGRRHYPAVHIITLEPESPNAPTQ